MNCFMFISECQYLGCQIAFLFSYGIRHHFTAKAGFCAWTKDNHCCDEYCKVSTYFSWTVACLFQSVYLWDARCPFIFSTGPNIILKQKLGFVSFVHGPKTITAATISARYVSFCINCMGGSRDAWADLEKHTRIQQVIIRGGPKK